MKVLSLEEEILKAFSEVPSDIVISHIIYQIAIPIFYEITFFNPKNSNGLLSWEKS